MTWRRRVAALGTIAALVGGCAAPTPDDAGGGDLAGEPESATVDDTARDGAALSVPAAEVEAAPEPEPSTTPSSPPTAPETPSATPSRAPSPEASDPPSWFRQRLLDVTATGFPAPQETPAVYADRRIRTVDHLPPPPGDAYVSSISPIPAEIVPVSTWEEGCPTTLEELRYVTVSYWGFDGLHHTGELILHRDVAEDLVGVFAQLHAARFPIEQIELLDDSEDFATFHRRGDDNVTAAYHCRASTGSDRWSQHAYGRAIDINPFHNPYWKRTDQGEVVLPAYATDYLDRDRELPGMITEGDVVVDAFDAIGWGWGGRWSSLKDWQHFSANGN